MNANNEKDQINLKNYFDALLEKNKNIDNEALAVLRKLIDLTLSFRDKLKAETGQVITVGETRQAIDIYMEAMQTEILPGDLPPRIDSLVKYWLIEINGATF